MRIILALLIASSAFVTATPAAEAQSRMCRQLAEMARGGGDSRDVRRELREAIKAADNSRCFGFFFGKHDSSCRALKARINRLEHSLQRGNSRPRLSDRQLQREISRHGCLERTPQTKVASGPSGQGYRTVCVRKCDGYFFPIAHQRHKGGFERDQKICGGIYGGDHAELYYYPSDGTIDTARSIGGRAYKDQSFAHLYQREFRPECQVQLQAGMSRVIESFIAATEKHRFKQFAMIPVPVPRPTARDEPDILEPIGAPEAQVVSRVIGGFNPYLPDETPLAFSDADTTQARREHLDKVFENLERQ
jgi:hypothetical protein